jgi:hypothetical protein
MVAPILADSAFIKFMQDKAHFLVENSWHILSIVGISRRKILLGHCTDGRQGGGRRELLLLKPRLHSPGDSPHFTASWFDS